MNSIGNDVVALAHIQPERTCQHRFYNKILSPAEHQLYYALPAGSLLFEHYVWLLWSAKESAYKFLKRQQPHLVFSPTRFIIQNLSATLLPGEYSGTVSYQSTRLPFCSILTSGYIHTVVSTNLPLVTYRVSKVDTNSYDVQSAAVRTLTLKHLAALMPSQALNITKHITGYPEVRKGNQIADIPLSLSHHGNFIAYAFQFNTMGSAGNFVTAKTLYSPSVYGL
ncbi:4'-phosphopantetheinyl transferase superfamily protein [Mucilaginibacter sp.]